ncbi:hypothetical protein SAMN04487926_1354 [Paraburkholderia steynii]|uniref:Uncharacterized protein n=1 Tax=Paraburkholderia steynii TaxID=1245441 RepID=A0A7Z7BFX7_9BURK|nr:hypothetical protein [Paraburkholderia steynii]SDJ14676.1 hypothetical protein SAMN04487926_1354 [Paraburkholderia steynii]
MTNRKRLPPGLRSRTQASGKTYHYLKTASGVKETPLGPDLGTALQYWRDHALDRYLGERNVSSVLVLIEAFITAEIPIRMMSEVPFLQRQARALAAFFLDMGTTGLTAPFPSAEAYFAYRGPRYAIRAGAEIRLFIHIWGWAQRLSLMKARAPCPWSSGLVWDWVRQHVLCELADALRQFASAASLPAQAPSPQDGIAASNYLASEKLEESSIPDSRSGSHAPRTIADQHEIDAFLARAARQFAADGRPDLAREVRRLSRAEVRKVIDLMPGSAGTLQTGAELILGTSRAARLEVMRLATKAKRR